MLPPALTAPATTVLRARLVSARAAAAVARATVASCRQVPWVSSAADAFRAALDDEAGRLVRLVAALDALLADVGVLGPWPPTMAEVRAGLSCRGFGGRSLRVGDGGFVSVDPAALVDTADRLAGAASTLDGAADDLWRAVWNGTAPWSSGGAAGERLRTLLSGPLRPAGVAGRLHDLAGTTRAAARVHADGEDGAHARLRWLATTDRGTVLGALALAVPALVAAEVAATWRAGLMVLGGASPREAAERTAAQAWSDAMAEGDAELAVTGLAAALTAVAPATLPDPVGVAARGLAGLLAYRSRHVTLVPRADPPRLAPPRGLAGLLDAVAKSYDEGQPTGLPGTAVATVTVERLDHPDGTRSWVVAVPGTQSWGFDGDVPTDMGTNLELVGGVVDPMTAGVVAAMDAAGIGPDEPVVLAGHSQGGMVAMSVAAVAAGAYRIGGVVTAGSPSVPARLPAGVPVVRLEHDEDVVPQTDGEPTAVGPDVTRVTRSLAGDHPVLPMAAHQVTGYVDTAARVDAGVAASPGSAAPGVTAVTALLGGDGTTATTFQYRIARAGAG